MPVLPASIAGGAHLAGEAAVIAAAVVLSSYLSLPSRLLEGVHTYIHPDNIGTGDGLRAAIRQPSDDASSTEQPQLKRRSRSERDGGASIPTFAPASTSLSTVGASSPPFLRSLASSSASSSPGEAPPILILRRWLRRPSRSSRRSLQRRTFSRPSPRSRSSDLPQRGPRGSSPRGAWRGFFVPAIRAARSLWLGTDQLRWNLDGAMSSGKISPILLSAAFVAGVVAPLMWIKPIVDFPARNSSPAKFDQFRIWLLAASATLQLLAVRPNLQTYLNEAVLSWYQMLHSSKIPDSDFARAKVFLHNHNLCLVVLQFFAIPALEMLLLGISQTTARSSGGALLPDFASTAKETALFFAWWISFVWAMYTISTLALLRCGFLLIS
ncbi:unnamed protein product [Spirodela intermedia]|uniref:Uncharacterized protein n=1 Tax=Spirodela intermedia TaxID=51605 RepID=A0A7I8JW04_SPIIN|nr:unnamed protein product [Spirodela intermedia]CAA6673642.1 unnamed protein product [Spirodela intermedia]